MRLRIPHIEAIRRLHENECKVLEEVLVCIEVRQWEARREEHVDEHDVESSDTEDGVVQESIQFVRMNALIQCLPLLLDSSLLELLLVFDHKLHDEDWVHA